MCKSIWKLAGVLIFVFSIVLELQNATAQTNKKGIKPPKVKSDLDCMYKPKYSVEQRNQFYPFNIPGTIKLVSFRYHRHNYPIKGDSLVNDSLVEVKELSKAQTDSLTDILYNNFYRRRPDVLSLTLCFFPRNAILFFDKKGQLKEYILLCFHCDRHEESADQVVYGDECLQKMDKLRHFFISSGLSFGTGEGIGLYPGESPGE